MDIKICENRQGWEELPFGSTQGKEKTLDKAEFLQSWDWGEFQRSAGKEVIRLQIEENEVVIGRMQGFVHELGMGMKYLYLPRAVISNWKLVISSDLLAFLKKKKFIFLRIESAGKLPITNYQLQFTKNRQPATTLLLDLEKSEEALLQQMHSKTRYNIGLAEKKSVEIKSGKDVEAFWKLNEETTGRDKFKSHNKDYYAKMLDNN
ncbi:aminoacyltransferase, partial [Patescibacteria group bacterium]|nr:aminoacyltransferase [Patescibacteria group bacterium]